MLYVEFGCHIVCVVLTRSGWEKCSGGAGVCSVWLCELLKMDIEMSETYTVIYGNKS